MLAVACSYTASACLNLNVVLALSSSLDGSGMIGSGACLLISLTVHQAVTHCTAS